jgi:hypothetical protein|uniref:Uncharacterized protein n=1 Tax=Siphoviridae sp. ctHip2 TaxID=2827830 RepID=A0A8S5RWT8_9CAUD|nr:MAG TPA: hypothetical protein [Siphoviridae sp. ctHip2]
MTLKDLTRQELLQIYYNEALELLFNQEKITKEWLTKIKEKFKLESFRLGVCFDKDNPTIIEEISVIDSITHKSRYFWSSYNELGHYEDVHCSEYTGNDRVVIKKIIELSKANKIYTMNCYDEDYLLNSETYKKLSSHFFKNLDYRLWQHNRDNYKIENLKDLHKLKDYTVLITDGLISLKHKTDDFKIEIITVSKPVDYKEEWKEEREY